MVLSANPEVKEMHELKEKLGVVGNRVKSISKLKHVGGTCAFVARLRLFFFCLTGLQLCFSARSTLRRAWPAETS